MENYTLFIEIELLLSLKEIADLFQGNIIHHLPKLPDKFGAKHSNETGRDISNSSPFTLFFCASSFLHADDAVIGLNMCMSGECLLVTPLLCGACSAHARPLSQGSKLVAVLQMPKRYRYQGFAA